MSILPLVIEPYGSFIFLAIGIAVAVATGWWVTRN
jgi:hypothetical protein